MSDECVELKNIKYQTMLLNKSATNEPLEDNISAVSDFLS